VKKLSVAATSGGGGGGGGDDVQQETEAQRAARIAEVKKTVAEMESEDAR
jgi:hypothetical protein